MKYTEAMQMRKTADGGVFNDTLGNLVSSQLPPFGGLASLGGAVTGLVEGPAKEKDLAKMDKKPGYSYIPGVGAYRLARKQLAAIDNDRPRKTLLSEAAGPVTSAIAPAALGAGLGAAFGGQQGAAIGALAGGGVSTAAQVLGGLIGIARRRRTNAERRTEDRSESLAANLFIPGVAGYRSGRRALDTYDDEVTRNELNELRNNSTFTARMMAADKGLGLLGAAYPNDTDNTDDSGTASSPAAKETDEAGNPDTTASNGDSEKSDDKEKTDEQEKEASLRKQARPATYQEYYDAYMNDPARVKERNSLNFIRPMSLMTLGAIRGAKVGMHYDRANIPTLQLAKNFGNQPSLIFETKGTLGGTAIGGGLGLSIGLLLNAAKRNSKAVKDSEAAGQYAYNRMLETRQARTQEAPKSEKSEADGTKEDKEQKKEAGLRMYTAALQMRKQAEMGVANVSPTGWTPQTTRQKTWPAVPWTQENTDNAIDAIEDAPEPEEVRQHFDRFRKDWETAQPAIDEFKFKYAPLINDAKKAISDKVRGLNWTNTNANALGVSVGSATAAGTHWLTGKMPWFQKHPNIRLLTSLLSGGLAGTYTAGGIKDRAINKAIVG